jgi:steroid 5-alpha reductase family enzyme
MLQGAIMLIIAAPIIVTNSQSNPPLTTLDYIGTIIWLIGFLFESIGDYQLFKFLQNPQSRGKIMKYGLWRYTRHPNYFGETLVWSGMWIISISAPFGLYAIISPITITLLLLFISGIPLTEKLFTGNLEYEQYKKETSAFIPLPPKK